MATNPAQTWTVYLVTCADNSLYCGVTTDLARRIAQHNGLLAGGAAYTRSRRPVTVTLALSSLSKHMAMSIEAKIKRVSRKKKLALFREYMASIAPDTQQG